MSGAALRAVTSDFFALDEALSSGACAESADAKLRAMESIAAFEIMMLSIDGRGGNSVGRGECREATPVSPITQLSQGLPERDRVIHAVWRSGLVVHFFPLVPASVPASSLFDLLLFLVFLAFLGASFFDSSFGRSWARATATGALL